MDMIRKGLLLLIIYTSTLLCSIGAFYALDGNFVAGELFALPSLWALWFYFLYLVVPLFVLCKLIFNIIFKRKPVSQLLDGFIFLISLIIIHLLYGHFVDGYKNFIYQKITATESLLQREINNISVSNVNHQFKLNKDNKVRSYIPSFTLHSEVMYDVDAKVDGFIRSKNDHISFISFNLLPEKQDHNLRFYIHEDSMRGKATSSDTLELNISYTANFPADQYQALTVFSQQLCTWSLMKCSNTGREGVAYNTQLFASSIITLPAKITGATVPLTQIILSDFTNLDTALPFDKIAFISEETNIEDGVINEFDLKFSVNSKIDGYIYSYLAFYSNLTFEELSGTMASTTVMHKSPITKGENTFSIPVNVNELSSILAKQKVSEQLKFMLFISNNRFWYCPNRTCEIVNMPHQMERLDITTDGKYGSNSFIKSHN